MVRLHTILVCIFLNTSQAEQPTWEKIQELEPPQMLELALKYKSRGEDMNSKIIGVLCLLKLRRLGEKSKNTLTLKQVREMRNAPIPNKEEKELLKKIFLQDQQINKTENLEKTQKIQKKFQEDLEKFYELKRPIPLLIGT